MTFFISTYKTNVTLSCSSYRYTPIQSIHTRSNSRHSTLLSPRRQHFNPRRSHPTPPTTCSANTTTTTNNNNNNPSPQTIIALGASSITAYLLLPTLKPLLSSFSSIVDPLVLSATINATFKLLLICSTVGWLLRSKLIPNSTGTVLSQVSFYILIPCMLFSKVVATLSTNPPISLLYLLAAAALGQIGFGALCGKVLSPLVDGSYDRSRKILGWHPLNPPASAAAIADGTARAAGIPAAAAALLPRQSSSSSLKGGNYSSSNNNSNSSSGGGRISGMKELATVSCAFGNSFTLPAVFFLTLLPPAAASKALGYAALFLLTWSPCLWSFGLSLVHGNVGIPSSSSSSVVVIGSATKAAADSSLNNTNKRKSRAEVVIMLKSFFQKTLNPPVVSILLGILVASTPLGSVLFPSSSTISTISSTTFLDNMPGVVRGGLKAIAEVISMMSEGTLPLQTLVLAASLLQKPEQQQQEEQQEVELLNTEGEPILTINNNNNNNSKKFSLLSSLSSSINAIKLLLFPSSGEEARALAIISLTRFLLLPLATATALYWATQLGWLGPAGVDPVLLFVILVQSVMPSAQNLIIVLQLSDKTRSSAPAYAKMLLKLYAAAIVPVTLWVTAFASNLKIPLAQVDI